MAKSNVNDYYGIIIARHALIWNDGALWLCSNELVCFGEPLSFTRTTHVGMVFILKHLHTFLPLSFNRTIDVGMVYSQIY